MPLGPAAGALASDETSLFFATGNPGGTEVIERVPVAGGTPVVLVDGRGGVPGIAVDADNVYWTESAGSPCGRGSQRCRSPADGSPILATGLGDTSQIVVDDSGVYFLSSGQIGKIPKQH